MALTDLIYDQRLCLRHPKPVAKRPQHHFRIRLSDGSRHDVLAANADDARLFVRRRNQGKKVLYTRRIGGKV
ncbi:MULTISPECIES: hypothetical protein [unclassified Shinella]|uniref:hypothetical protein n=1 Tax=unclassified Shinella TaxID=2643062 RepID=UPI00234E8B50|nr:MULTISPECIES: hypothetical protein [unclassified Shinella]MCO5153356.1 hypothetical protein [Shinella sp.]MDC7260535.1 hypothetical protein [Shinella sp. HY16]MDC7267430.1 hypothetical protein [Shinella sp. YZ44]